MNKAIILIFLFILFIPSFGQDDSKKPAVADLGLISGCWKKPGKNESSFTMEHWTKPAGMMLAVSRSIRNGKVGFFEYLRIAPRDGEIYYIAKPANAKTETPFKLTSLKNREAIFENPQHDFPQRIVYKLTAKDSIAVRVEAEKDGRTRGFGFSMSRVSCD